MSARSSFRPVSSHPFARVRDCDFIHCPILIVDCEAQNSSGPTGSRAQLQITIDNYRRPQATVGGQGRLSGPKVTSEGFGIPTHKIVWMPTANPEDYFFFRKVDVNVPRPRRDSLGRSGILLGA